MTTRVSAERWHKNTTCKVFGHKVEGYLGGTPYGRLSQGATDGLGTVHMSVIARCDRCNERVTLCHFHLPKRWKEAVRLPDSPLVLNKGE